MKKNIFTNCSKRIIPHVFFNNKNLFYLLICFCFLLIGVFFRFRGIIDASLNRDEVALANILGIMTFGEGLRGALVYANQRPYLFLLSTKLITTIYNTEWTLRLIPLLSGILSILSVFWVSYNLFKNKLIVILSVFFVAFNPYLINFSKEFKPYIVEYFLSTLLLLFYLQWQNTKNRKWLVVYSISILFFVLLGHPVIFIIPCISFSFLYFLYKTRQFNDFKLVLISTLLSALLFFIQWYYMGRYVDVWELSLDPGEMQYFYTANQFSLHYLLWLKTHFHNMLTELMLPSFSKNLPASIKLTIQYTFVICFFLGLIKLFISKMFDLALVLLGPIIMMFATSCLGNFLWPFGAVRMNLFAMFFLTLISLCGVQLLFQLVKSHAIHCLFISAVILPLWQYDFNLYKFKRGDLGGAREEFRQGIESLMKNIPPSGEPTAIVFNRMSHYPYDYYTKLNSTTSSVYTDFFSDKNVFFLRSHTSEGISTEINSYSKKFKSIWFVFYHYNGNGVVGIRRERKYLDHAIEKQNLIIEYNKFYPGVFIYNVKNY